MTDNKNVVSNRVKPALITSEQSRSYIDAYGSLRALTRTLLLLTAGRGNHETLRPQLIRTLASINDNDAELEDSAFSLARDVFGVMYEGRPADLSEAEDHLIAGAILIAANRLEDENCDPHGEFSDRISRDGYHEGYLIMKEGLAELDAMRGPLMAD